MSGKMRSWPNLVGKTGQEAVEIIQKESGMDN
jgi:hypothetical protein